MLLWISGELKISEHKVEQLTMYHRVEQVSPDEHDFYSRVIK
uniref:Uncharacterized protein n=1 Tax=Arundo donax TaxID=35708 RepID=A0A0A8XWF6_ARUDO